MRERERVREREREPEGERSRERDSPLRSDSVDTCSYCQQFLAISLTVGCRKQQPKAQSFLHVENILPVTSSILKEFSALM